MGKFQISNFKFQILLVAFAITTAFPAAASAHVLETDRSIGAVLHINPEDDPVAGQDSSFFFEFKDKENKFSSSKCECLFTVLRAGTAIYTQPLFQNQTDTTSDDAGITYTFPEKDVYVIRVSGKPKTPNAFQSFQLDYSVRVARSAGQAASQSSIFNNWWVQHTPHLLILLVIIVFLIKSGLKERSAKQSKQDDVY